MSLVADSWQSALSVDSTSVEWCTHLESSKVKKSCQYNYVRVCVCDSDFYSTCNSSSFFSSNQKNIHVDFEPERLYINVMYHATYGTTSNCYLLL